MLPISAIPPQMFSPQGVNAPGMDAASLAEMKPLTREMTEAGGITATTKSGDSFAATLGQLVQDVNAKQMAAGDAVNRLQSGGPASLHETMIAMEEANVSFQLMVEVRNKLLESYQELMRMQV